MSFPGLIWRNAARNRRRLILTVSSVAVSLFLLTMLQVMLKGLTNPDTTAQAATRIVVRHRVSLANMLFSKYQQQIEQMPGVAACTKLLWFGGIYQDERNFFPQFACDAERLFQVMTEAGIDPDQRRQFETERTACVVGIKTMQRFGWKIGDRITLLGAMWPCNPELTIRGAYTGFDETNLYFHHDYLDELLGDRGFTGLFWVRTDGPLRVPELIERIDATFQNSDAETISETERSFQLGFVSMMGNVKMLIGSISTVIVFALVLVATSTMSMSVRERTAELAIMKALGFATRRLVGLLLAESLLLSVIGGAFGCLAAWVLLRSFDMYKLSRGMFVNFEVTPRMLGLGLGTAILLGVVSCLWPAWSTARRPVVEGLRTVE